MQKLRKTVFFPPFLLLLISALLSLYFPEQFLKIASGINTWILQHFDWLFSWSTLFFLVILGVTYFSPLSKIKIGGKEAKPLLTRWQWFSITLCTTIATGILFWGTAEPMFHVHSEALDTIKDKKTFAMSTMFMHWTITPYGIYTLAGLVFALCFYNLKQPFSVSAMLYPLAKEKSYGAIGQIADAICLFALVAGMSASLGTGILAISGGLNRFLGINPDKIVYAFIGLGIVIAFIISASTGLKKGIKFLSLTNTYLFIGLALFVFFMGPMGEVLSLGWNGFKDYLINFFPRSLGLDSNIKTDWVQNWTVFYWANWLAWTPITAIFLGRLAYGYTVKEFIWFNLLFPSLFGALWMVIFSGTTIALDDLFNYELHQSLQTDGPQSVIYQVLAHLPFAEIMGFIFLFIVFISYVTAADSNTSAMTGMSIKGVSPDEPETPLYLKVIWGVLVGVVSWVMISFAGVDGVKMISNLGGLPALFLVILVGAGMIKLIWKRKELF